ncbi:Serine-arginine regulated nuclear matrix protein [Balamuthia mandrillaris]
MAGAAGFFRGTSAEQDSRFSDKTKKYIKSTGFPPEFDIKVNLSRVSLEAMKPWITARVTQLLNFEDELLINFVVGLLEQTTTPNPKEIQHHLEGFLEKDAALFTKELWNLLLSAQSSPTGIPAEFLEKKKEELRRNKEEQARLQQALIEKKATVEKELEDRRRAAALPSSASSGVARQDKDGGLLSFKEEPPIMDEQGRSQRSGREKDRYRDRRDRRRDEQRSRRSRDRSRDRDSYRDHHRHSHRHSSSRRHRDRSGDRDDERNSDRNRGRERHTDSRKSGDRNRRRDKEEETSQRLSQGTDEQEGSNGDSHHEKKNKHYSPLKRGRSTENGDSDSDAGKEAGSSDEEADSRDKKKLKTSGIDRTQYEQALRHKAIQSLRKAKSEK